MKFDRKFFSVLLAASMIMSMLLPVSAATMDATYGEASYYDIAVEAYSRMLMFHDGVVAAANQSRQYGLITSIGEVRVDFQYDDMCYLTNDMFSVEKNNRYGIIDTKGNELIPISHRRIVLVKGTYIEIDGSYYDQNLNPVSKTDVYPDELDELAESLGYDWMYSVGFNAFKRYIAGKYVSNIGYTYYLLDGDNSYRVLLSADWLVVTYSGWSVEETILLTHTGIYDGNGALVYDASAHGQRISSEDFYYSRYSSMVIVENIDNSLKGAVDLAGSEMIPCEYQRIGNENGEGYIGAVKANGSGFVDSDIYRADGSLIKTFQDTYIATEVYYRHMAFNRTEGGLNGMMDIDGNILIPANYTAIRTDNSGSGYYDDSSNLLVLQGDEYYGGTYGLYDQEGNVIFQDGYESITYLDNNRYKLRDNGMYGVMSTSGSISIPFHYRDMRVHTTSFIELYDGRQYKIVDLDNNSVVRESIRQINLFRPLNGDFGVDLGLAASGTLPFCIYTRDTGYVTVYADPATGENSGELLRRTSNINSDNMFAYQADSGLFGFGKLGVSDDVLASGECGKYGDNLTWVLDSDGTLTISGTGEMADADNPADAGGLFYGMLVREDLDRRVSKVVIESGATTIGDCAFMDLRNMVSVEIPSSVTSISGTAFSGCASLKNVSLPNRLTEISYTAFAACDGLESITIPVSVTSVQDGAFMLCNSLSDVYYAGTEAQWSAITIEEGNDPLLNATIHYNSTGPESAQEIPQGVKYVPYSYMLSEDTILSDYQLVQGNLPSGLALSADGELSGVPMEEGAFEFTIRARVESSNTRSTTISINGALYRQFTTKLTILNNTNAAVQQPNDYEIIENVGERDPRDPNSFLMTEYREETFAIDGPYEEFYRLLIDGRERLKDVDYTVREGSTIITVRAQTFRSVGEGTHTIAAEFRSTDSNGKTTTKQVAQNYTLTIRQSGSNTGNSNSSSSSSSSSASINYSITVPEIPNCTIKVTPSSASAGTRVTLTVKPYTGYLLNSVTVTGPNGQIALTQTGDGKYTFRMPSGKVDISAQVTAEKPAAVPVEATPFTDIAETDWFYNAVHMAYQRGWMVGVSADTFAPYEETSRGMIVSVLYRIAGQPAVSNTYFSDVPLNQYYTAAAAWAAEQGIITGYGDGRFGPLDSLTREQIVIILYNYASQTGMDTTARSEMAQFTDLDQISAGARTAMSWAHAVGLISGVGNGTLNPVGHATRAEMAAFLARFTVLTENNE